jgi:hypothetical protein
VSIRKRTFIEAAIVKLKLENLDRLCKHAVNPSMGA